MTYKSRLARSASSRTGYRMPNQNQRLTPPRPSRVPMPRADEILRRILRGTADANIPFSRLCRLLRKLGFEERTRGSHHIFAKDGIEEILNLQPKESKAKPYQVKQVRHVIIKYRLGDA